MIIIIIIFWSGWHWHVADTNTGILVKKMLVMLIMILIIIIIMIIMMITCQEGRMAMMVRWKGDKSNQAKDIVAGAPRTPADDNDDDDESDDDDDGDDDVADDNDDDDDDDFYYRSYWSQFEQNSKSKF